MPCLGFTACRERRCWCVCTTDSGGVCEAALRALAGVLTVTPAALRNHEPALTAAVAQLLLSPAAPAVRRQAALCFALLPHVRGTVGT